MLDVSPCPAAKIERQFLDRFEAIEALRQKGKT
jgi:hypothetical protein